MTVELMDMNVPYYVQTDVNNYGVDHVRITPEGAPDEHTICLRIEEIDELILTLQFMKKVLKSYKK